MAPVSDTTVSPIINFHNPRSLDFDSTDDYVDTGFSEHFTQTTVAAWIRPNTLGENSRGRIVDKRTVSAEHFNLFLDPVSSRLSFTRLFAGGNGGWGINSAITIGIWQHVTLTYDRLQCKQ